MTLSNSSASPDYYLELLQTYQEEMQLIKEELEDIKGIPISLINRVNYLYTRVSEELEYHLSQGQPQVPYTDETDF